MNTIESTGKDCVGCRSCEQSCPAGCISMEEDREGFLYPRVDASRCRKCGLCLKKCPVRQMRQGSFPINFYAYRGLSGADTMRSASGGFSDSAVRAVLESGGTAYGAAFCPDPSGEKEMEVRHIRVTDDSGRRRIQSSKYVQSDLNTVYAQTKKDLLSGTAVLFTGTPCQIAGLYAFLGDDHPLLYTMDLICHGVPSPLLLREYLRFCRAQTGEPVEDVNFRSKDGHGWGTSYRMCLKTGSRTVLRSFSADRYGRRFLAGDCYRESCYRCRYACLKRQGDITAGDFWGIWKSCPKFDSPLGVSLVLINTEKGKELFQKVKDRGDVRKIRLQDALYSQGNLQRPALRPENRDRVYDGIREEGYMERMKTGPQIVGGLKSLLPRPVTVRLKQFFR